MLSGLFFAFLACTQVEPEPPFQKVSERPLMLFSDTTLLDFYEGPVLSWRLKTAWLERWGGNGRVFARPIFVDIYDSLGYKAAFLRADSGELDSRMSYVKAYGHVYSLTPKGASVRADSLIWNKRTNRVETQSYVRVVSEDGDVLQGTGFVSDAKLDNWQILSNVTGIFQDAANRMKNEDSTQRTKDSLSSLSQPPDSLASTKSMDPPKAGSVGHPGKNPMSPPMHKSGSGIGPPKPMDRSNKSMDKPLKPTAIRKGGP